MNSPDPKNLLAARLLSKNVAYNLVGYLIPMLVALIAIPELIQALGKDKYGLLSISWLIIGYFSFFDLGLGRVVAKMISEKLGLAQQSEIPSIFISGLIFMFFLGIMASLICLSISSLLVNNVLKIPQAFTEEALNAIYLIAVMVPLVTMSSGLRGVLEAYQYFFVINVIRIVNGSFTFLGPLFVTFFTTNFFIIILVLGVWRLLLFFVFLYFSVKTVNPGKLSSKIDMSLLKPMIGMGGWMSISNVLGQLMVYIDRFLIGAWISLTAVSFYVPPYDIVTKITIVTGAFVKVLFPAFSNSYNRDREKSKNLYSQSTLILISILVPIVLILVLIAEPALDFWLGKEFAQKSTKVAQWLALGVFFNAPAQIAFALIQAAGKPNWTAKVHIIELPFYFILLYVGISQFGIIGVSIAWAVRMFFDALFFFYLSHKISPNNIHFKIFGVFLFISMICIFNMYSENFLLGSIITFFSLVFYFYILITKLLNVNIKAFLNHQFKG